MSQNPKQTHPPEQRPMERGLISRAETQTSPPELVDISNFVGPWGQSASRNSSGRSHRPEHAAQRAARTTSGKSSRRPREKNLSSPQHIQDYLSRSFRSDWRLSTVSNVQNDGNYTELRDLATGPWKSVAVPENKQLPTGYSAAQRDQESLLRRSSSLGSMDLSIVSREPLRETDEHENDSFELGYTMTGPLSKGTGSHNDNRSNIDDVWAGSPKKPRTSAMWQPWELRRRTLLCFVLFYASVMIVIGLLYWASQHYQGLGSSTYRYHYLWTYGPTACKCA